MPLHELIGRCKGWEGMPEKLEAIGKLLLSNSKTETGPRKWQNRIRLEPVRDNKKLVYDEARTDVLVFGQEGDTQLEECAFTVLNGNVNETKPDVSALHLEAVSVPPSHTGQSVWARTLMFLRVVT